MNTQFLTNQASASLLAKIVATTLLLLTLWVTPSVNSVAQAAKADPSNASQVNRGKVVYDKFCSLCHGKELEGQPNWRKRNDNGKLPAPPQNGTGHTWHHADELLFGIVKDGVVPPYGPPNYKTDMPAWGSTLSDADIWAVLAYIKSRWPAEARKIQAEINQQSLK